MEQEKKFPFMTIALLLVVGAFWFFFSFFSSGDNIASFKKDNDLENKVAREIDGVLVSEDNQNQSLVAVVIDNFSLARPQSAIADANLVYEIQAESYITRFLAFYDLSAPLVKIGPVRSARDYLIDIASEYGAVFVHSGGSPEALDRLKNERAVYDLNEFFSSNQDYFWRDNNKYAPHNLYTSVGMLKDLKEDSSLNSNGDYRSWKFKDDSKARGDISNIRIDFSSDTAKYQVVWKYDKEINSYKRWQNNQPHLDENNKSIIAKNIVVQIARMKVIDDVGRKDINLDGTGDALVFQDGAVVESSWIKEKSRTLFLDQHDNEIKLNRGTTWVEIVPTWLEVVY